MCCTMMSSIDFVKARSTTWWIKRPKLTELHKFIFDEDFDDAHDAMADIEATAKCFHKLVEYGYIKTVMQGVTKE